MRKPQTKDKVRMKRNRKRRKQLVYIIAL